MKQLIFFITLLVVTLPQLNFAEDEVIWETEKIPYLHGVLVAPQGELLYNIKGKILEIRRISDGVKIDSIVIDNVPNYLYKMSITDDGRYMAFSGDNPYVIIYDLQSRREVKRITTIAYEREEFGKNVVYNATQWISSSISPDGTKITGIAAWGGTMTNFVVIDIATEKVLFEQRRITYDGYNPSNNYYKWHSAEYSPDGNYIVSQLEFRAENDINAPDSVYIYNANTLEVYDALLNTYSDSKIKLTFSYYQPMFAFYKSSLIYIYDITDKRLINTDLKPNSPGLIFSRNSNQIIYAFDFENHIYDIDSKEILYKYENPKLPKTIAIDNSTMIGFLNNRIYGLKTYFTKSTVETNPIEIIISPNPTNGLVNITLDCQSPQIKYRINNTSGQNLESKVITNNSSLLINFNHYPVGIYYLTIECNRLPKTYKIVKGN